MEIKNSSLVIVDMQNYYLNNESSYYQYFNNFQPGCLEYIINRCEETVIPNILKLKNFFYEKNQEIIYLKLCSEKKDRSDLHRFFKKTNDMGEELGFKNIYPLINDTMSDIVDRIKPGKNDIIIPKKTYSAFTSSNIKSILKKMKIKELVFTGLATSQCVETTARDASDHGYEVILIEDAMADYDELTHNSSLFSSQGVCGSKIFSTEDFINFYNQ